MTLPQDRVVFVTGASGGIGRATAEAFLRDGARVAACARSEIQGLQGALTIRCDVSDREQVNRAVDAVIAKFGALHVLVNNAGFGVYGPLETLTPGDLEDVFRTNVYGALWATQAALPHLKRVQGQVINVSSILARFTCPYAAAYCMTKHALHSMSEGLRMELRASGVHVIEVGPGLTATEFQKNARWSGFGDRPVINSMEGCPPEKVAQVILKASRRDSREVWLTAAGKAFLFLHDRFPRFLEWGLRRWARRRFPVTPDGTGDPPRR